MGSSSMSFFINHDRAVNQDNEEALQDREECVDQTDNRIKSKTLSIKTSNDDSDSSSLNLCVPVLEYTPLRIRERMSKRLNGQSSQVFSDVVTFIMASTFVFFVYRWSTLYTHF